MITIEWYDHKKGYWKLVGIYQIEYGKIRLKQLLDDGLMVRIVK